MDARHGVRYAAAMPLLFRITIQERKMTQKNRMSHDNRFSKNKLLKN